MREAVKRRTVELEQKNKELAIEASLERVRARAMAMQNSNELSELVDTVFKELTKLDLALSWCMINSNLRTYTNRKNTENVEQTNKIREWSVMPKS